MSESRLWLELYGGMANSWHASRVESHSTSAGIPDVDYCINGVEGHLELKYSKSNKPPEIRNTQIKWHTKRRENGGRSYILTKMKVDGRWHYLFHFGYQASWLNVNRFCDHWVSSSLHIMLDALDIETVKQILEHNYERCKF